MDKKQVDIYSLSPMQEAMLFHSLYDQGNSYFKQLLIQVEGDFDPGLFEKSLNVLIERYDIFRTVFIYKKLKKPRQVVLQEREAKIQYQDFSHLPEDERNQKVEAWIRKDQTKPFDLSKDLLLRVSVLKTGSQQYQIVFSSHHILLDGWCMGIVFEDLFEIYGKLKNHEPVPHKKVTQYRELIRWLEKQDPKETEQYWKQYLAGYEGHAKIPGAKTARGDDYKLEEVRCSLDETLTRQFNQFAREHHLTLNNVFQTIWGLMLQRYNHTDDVVFGSVVSGRNKDIPRIQEIVGLFINTIPVRVKASGDDRFTDLAKQVQQAALASEPYDYASLTDIQKAAQCGDSLVDHIVVFENYVFDSNIFHKYRHQLGFVVTDAKSTFEKTNYDFNVIVVPCEKFTILFQYNGHVYQREDVESCFRHFERIVRQVIGNPDCRLKDIELVSPSEKQQWFAWNQTDADYPRDKTVQEIFEEQAEKSPQQIALKFRGNTMTYKELNEQANQLARVLRKQGVRRGDIVGLMTERSFEMMIGMLAAVKAGGAYMPIDPEYPAGRKEFMLEDAGAPVLMVQPGLKVPAGYKGRVVELAPGEWAGEEKSNPENVNQPDDLLYVMYTSGSTGKPKGILTMHYNVMRTVINNGYIQVHAGDRLLQLSNYCFDGSTFDIYNALLNGATLVLVPKEASKDFAELTKLIREEEITVTFMTTSLFNTVVDLDLDCLKSLRKIVFGGEKASVKHVQKAVQALGGNRLINGYGPTETTVFAATYSIDPSVLATHRVPIGKPLNNTKLYVLDPWGNLQPPGIPGELCVSGDGVAKAYLNRPELNETRFVPDPFHPGQRMYRTGDLVRLLPDGHLEYLERMDNQVKIRGHRIETGEVEKRLFAHPDVLNAVVLADKDQNGHSYLCAYVVLKKDVSPSALREHMTKALPEYMIPDYFVKLDQLPFTPNGKVDLRALPKPAEALENKRDYVAPTNPVEEKLVKVWQEVLDADQVGIHDNFFDLGGHSLKAMMLSSRVSKELNADLPLREIFARPTVQQQAVFLQNKGKKEYTGIAPAPEMKDYPVTSAQKRLYMVSQLEGSGTSYNMPYVFRIHGDLSVPGLKSVLQSLVDRHESLRTSFHMINGELRQKIHPDARLVVEQYQAGGKRQEKRVIQEFIRPFDLQKAPLMRAGVLERTDTREKYLLLDFHHIVADGVSIRQWFSDFSRRMQGEELPSLPLQYKDYAYWQQHEKQKDRWKKHEEYWLNELSGELPVLQLPTDFPRPKVQRFDGDQLPFEMDAGLSDQLRQLADEQNATMYMVLFAAYHVLLSKYAGQEDLIVGSPIAGRPHADLETMVGMFANTLAVRTRPTPDVSFARFLAQLKEQILEMAEHQDYPFEELVEKLGAERDLSRNPLFDTMFSLQKNELPALQFRDFSLELVEWDWKKSKFDMSWILIEDEKIKGIVEFATHLFKPETVKRMVRHYLHILKQITENPDLRLSDIKLITPDEEHQVLNNFNAYRLEYPRGRTIPSWFEERVEKQPDRVAVVCGEERWTYEELNRQANRLAHALRKKGIGREQLVGILMSPSKEMMAAVLGVLKAGAAYVPIDPQYPADRIQYMLKDSGASLLLTDRPAVPGSSGVEVWDMKTKDFRGESDDNPAPVNKERDLAYVIYTSGSTGKPKGVMVEHASLINLCEWHIREFQVTPEDKSIKYAGVGFDASVWEIFPTWMAGASLHIIEEAMRYDLEALNRYMEEQGITVAFLPTPVAEQFMQLENRSLRVLLTGGDRLGRVLPQNYTVVNNYGPTENTVVTTSTPVRPDEPVTIGKPVANNQVYVLNEHQQLQPIGVPGELCVSGESLARGYLNRPELTAEKFVPNPYVPGQKMYRTGDLVRWLPDGRLEFLGRMDEQVKIRGYRIEPGEIANRLLEHASVREAFVTVQLNPSQEPELCAYFAASSPCSAEELREHLSLKLPDYMVPVHFIEMEKLPLTRNGKVDKKALPLPEADTTRSKDDAPATPAEEQLIEILKEILHTEQIGVHDSFFEKGGNSLKGMMLSAQVHKRMHTELPLREIFARPVVKEMAAYIENQKTAEHVTIAPAPKQAYYPVSSAQKRLYVVGQLEGMGTGYNMPHAFSIRGNLPVSRLEEAFRALVERHESLRTSFHLIDGELMQKIHTDVEVRVECYQAQDRPDVKQKIQQFIRPFDLEKAPLIRVGMIEHAKEEEQILVIDMHHIISDGVSMNILFQDLMKCLQGETLPPVSLQYKDYAVWQQKEKKRIHGKNTSSIG
ncbi:amino acid adenylation domain-containing protein [Thermoactinomyces vulgaris]|uniref:non-ribosomal peptide synthetase n=1 Tax=Thermoactinomyces vulgaris TaxID=2026 RepID=UPI001F2F5CE9|nr:non-ribosomal peptide synthetase [Thermoactinomyces vulgaris]MCF6134633.1 amino acid adenylation domain-containing protein [Thermoactinomyces vulgaris]